MFKQVTAALAAISVSALAPAHADSFANASEASADSAEASARLVASGGQIASGAVALPIASAGLLTESVGKGAVQLSEDLWEAANAPLTVDERTAIAQPAPSVPRTPAPQPRHKDDQL